MGELVYKQGDILECDETVLCHQCNCVSKKAAGLAKQIFDKWPVSNVYKTNRSHEEVGSVLFSNISFWNDIHERLVSSNTDGLEVSTNFNYTDVPSNFIIAHLFGQVYPGKPKWGIDSRENRLTYFRKCLKCLLDFHFADYTGSGIESGQTNIMNTYAFPYKISCGLAGGSWDHYLKQIEKFAKKITTHVAIYRI